MTNLLFLAGTFLIGYLIGNLIGWEEGWDECDETYKRFDELFGGKK